MKTFAIGDIHGQLKALEQCLERAQFDFDNDRLICLGDVADRGPETYECFELLLSIKNLIYILGNHDSWLLQFWNAPVDSISTEWFANWQKYGGRETLVSYQKNNIENYERHYQLLHNANLFFLDESNRLYMHGGFKTGQYLEEQSYEEFCWDRTLWQNTVTLSNEVNYQLNSKTPVYSNTIFIGHTSTHRQYFDLKPQKMANVWNLDQGAGHGFKLTIMNIDNFAYWQSDLVSELYV